MFHGPCPAARFGFCVVVTVLLTMSVLVIRPAVAQQTSAQQEQRWEQTLTSSTSYANPYTGVTVQVNFSGPNGQSFSTYGFWDSGNTFKIRAAFPTAGAWSWTTSASDTANAGLHNRTGTVTVSAYSGANSLYKHGMLKTSANNRYLTYGDGTPFNWTGDTAWNGSWFSTDAEWARYVDARAQQGYNLVQVHATHSKEFTTSANQDGNAPFDANGKPNPGYWQDLEQKIEYANSKGLAVMLVGVGKPQSDDYTANMATERFARYIAGRLHGNHVILSPSMDLGYHATNDTMATYLNAATSRHLVTQHVSTNLASAQTYHGKSNLDFNGMQSGHHNGNIANAYDAARNWTLNLYNQATVKPVINTEAMYDGKGNNTGGQFYREMDARKLGWLSRLSGAAGYTYGAGITPSWVSGAGMGIWGWSPLGKFDHWETAVNWNSGAQVARMGAFFDEIDWWRLVPAHDLIENQGTGATGMALARTAEGDLAVAYLPGNASIQIDMSAFPTAMLAEWFNPVNGSILEVTGQIPNASTYTFARPSGWDDAVLTLTAIPEPGALGLLALTGALLASRRRRG